MATTIQLVIGDKDESQSVTEGEKISLEMLLPAGASDTSVTLGSLTDPKYIAVYGGEGISFKVAAGTDALAANPFAVISDYQDGLGIASILLSNSHTQSCTVYVYAGE